MIDHAGRPQPILIVEDSEDDYEATMRALKNVHLVNPLCWCRSGQDALDFLRHQGKYQDPEMAKRPGLIMLDLNMPGIDGRRTLQLIKEDTELKDIPIIILTTSGDEQDVAACYQGGANTYIQKPVTFAELIEAMKRLKEYWFEIALLPKPSQQQEGGTQS